MISDRSSLGAGAWERVINGVRYWFNATPFEMKVFRLRPDGGDLIHHWQDVPETIGEYHRYDAATHPRPGQIAWTRHWDPRKDVRQYVTACRVCSRVVDVTREQRVASHSVDGYGHGACAGSDRAATLKAALLRDAQPSEAERRVKNAVGAFLTSCRGFDSITGDDCHHPICHERAEQGLRWTLAGWKAA